jgi:hypothetical protein
MPFNFKTFFSDILFFGFLILNFTVPMGFISLSIALAYSELEESWIMTHKEPAIVSLLFLAIILIFLLFFIFRGYFTLKWTLIQGVATSLITVGIALSTFLLFPRENVETLILQLIISTFSFVFLKHGSDSILLRYNVERRVKKER